MDYIQEIDHLKNLIGILDKLKREIATTHNKKMRYMKELEQPKNTKLEKSKANLDWHISHTNALRTKTWSDANCIIKKLNVKP